MQGFSSRRPHIRIEGAGDSHPANTKVYDESGNELTFVERIVLDLDVHKSEAEAVIAGTLYAVDLGGSVHAEIEELKVKVLPPTAPKTVYKLVIGEPMDVIRPSDIGTGAEPYSQSGFRLERHDPLPSWGENVNVLATGFMAPVGPLELVMEEAG